MRDGEDKRRSSEVNSLHYDASPPSRPTNWELRAWQVFVVRDRNWKLWAYWLKSQMGDLDYRHEPSSTMPCGCHQFSFKLGCPVHDAPRGRK